MPICRQLQLISFLCLLSACGSEPVHFTLLQLNDVYEITPLNAGKNGGLARVATLQKQLKAENAQTYSILAGDLLSPSALGTANVDGERLKGQQMIALLNHLHWDYATFGNHEFDIGKTALLKRLSETQTVFFSSNALDSATQQPFPHTQQTVTLNIDGVSVGLVGITIAHTQPDFVSFLDPFTAAQQAIARLKAQETDMIVLVTHQDLDSDIEFAEKLNGVDLIIGGHEHENVYMKRGANWVPIAKADANAKSAYVHRISVDKSQHTKQIDSQLIVLDESIAQDAETAKVVNTWQEKGFAAFRKQGFEPERVICHSQQAFDGLDASVRNNPTALTALIAQAFLHAQPGADLALYNSGSIRIDDVLAPGAITEYDVIKILPFGGSLSLVEMSGELLEKTLTTGAQLKGKGSFLHYAGVQRQDNRWQMRGQAIEPKRRYKVVMDNFLFEQGDEGLEFLTLNHRPALTRLNVPEQEPRQALIKELITSHCGSPH